MVVCNFHLRGLCRYGSSCKNEHPGINKPTVPTIPSTYSVDTIKVDLTTDRPVYALSSYSPGKGESNLIDGLDLSPEELRMMFVTAKLANNPSLYTEQSLVNSAEQAVAKVLNDSEGAFRYAQSLRTSSSDTTTLPSAFSTTTNRQTGFGNFNSTSAQTFGSAGGSFGGSGSSAFRSAGTTNATSAFGAGGAVSNSPFGTVAKSSAFGGGGAFGSSTGGTSGGFGAFSGGAASTAPVSAFGQSAFGTGSNTTSSFGAPAFGSSTAFGQPSTTTSAFGAPAFGSTTSSFGTTPSSAFGSTTSAFGSNTSAFGSASSAPNPFLPQTATTTTSAFGTPAFGSSSLVPASSPFGTSPAFPSSTSTTSAFGASPVFGSSNLTSAFGSSTTSGGFGAFGSSLPAVASTSGGFGSFSATPAVSSAFGAGGVQGTSAFGAGGIQGPPQPPVNNPFGATTTTSVFGASGTVGGFGGTSTGGFSAFGQPQTQTSAFGSINSNQNNSPFGSTPAVSSGGGFGSSGTIIKDPYESVEKIKDWNLEEMTLWEAPLFQWGKIPKGAPPMSVR